MRLTRLIRRLRSFHGPPAPPPLRDPYRLLLWEQVGYMASDPERLAAYQQERAPGLGAPAGRYV